MTDKELLELAAKAAGCVYLTNGQLYVEGKGNIDWNPLTDDGDALRLAVKLCFEIDIHHTGVAVRTPQGQKILIKADASYTAIRRAIVRAAAEVGKLK